MQFARLITVTFLIVLVSGVLAQADKTVRLTNGEWKPFQSEDLPDYGPYSLIAKRAFVLSGYQVEFGFFPWKRAQSLVKQGEWDGTFFWVSTPEREIDYLVSRSAFHFDEVIFARMDDLPSFKTPESFEGKTMGRLNGSAFGAQFNDMIERGAIAVIEAKTNEQLFELLATGRADFVPELLTSGYEAVDQFDHTTIGHSDLFTTKWTYHMLISRKIPDGEELLTAFHAGLDRLEASGELDRILDPVIRPQR